jgi:hypothetical protein
MREASFATRKWYVRTVNLCRLGRPAVPPAFTSTGESLPRRYECTIDESEIERPYLFASRRSGVRST